MHKFQWWFKSLLFWEINYLWRKFISNKQNTSLWQQIKKMVCMNSYICPWLIAPANCIGKCRKRNFFIYRAKNFYRSKPPWLLVFTVQGGSFQCKINIGCFIKRVPWFQNMSSKWRMARSFRGVQLSSPFLLGDSQHHSCALRRGDKVLEPRENVHV